MRDASARVMPYTKYCGIWTFVDIDAGRSYIRVKKIDSNTFLLKRGLEDNSISPPFKSTSSDRDETTLYAYNGDLAIRYISEKNLKENKIIYSYETILRMRSANKLTYVNKRSEGRARVKKYECKRIN